MRKTAIKSHRAGNDADAILCIKTIFFKYTIGSKDYPENFHHY